MMNTVTGPTQPEVHVTSVYPVLQSDDPQATSRFFAEAFGFTTGFETDWYVSTRLPYPPGYEIAFLATDHPTIPQGYQGASRAVIVNIEVADVDAVYRHLVEDLEIVPVQPLRSESFGQRHVIVAAPGGVLVDVITPIEPTGEFVGQDVGLPG